MSVIPENDKSWTKVSSYESAAKDEVFNKQHVGAKNYPTRIYGDDSDSDVDNATQEAVKSRPIFRNICDVTEGLFKSRIFRTVVNTALVGLGIGLLFVLISNPVGWIATAVGVSLLAAKLILSAGAITAFALMGILAQFPRQGTMEFEISAINKLRNSQNYDEIPLNKSNNRLFLGAIPNALKNYETMQELVGRNGTVIAVMENWELTPQGLSIPITQKDYDELDISFFHCSAPDHEIIPSDDLNNLADKIQKELEKGNVYVHCRGGAGRSAAAVAAYLMKYEGFSIEEAAAWIKHYRPNSTIWNKIHGLRDYQTQYVSKVSTLSEDAKKAADTLQQLEAAGKKPKLAEELIQQLQNSTFQSMQQPTPEN